MINSSTTSVNSLAKPEIKLNVFALPNQTTILFGVIVVVLLGAMFAGSIGSSPIIVWPLALALLFLPLRAAMTSDTHGPEMDKIWCLLGEERVRERFEAAADLGKK